MCCIDGEIQGTSFKCSLCYFNERVIVGIFHIFAYNNQQRHSVSAEVYFYLHESFIYCVMPRFS